jgi:hypothetical protein
VGIGNDRVSAVGEIDTTLLFEASKRVTERLVAEAKKTSEIVSSARAGS